MKTNNRNKDKSFLLSSQVRKLLAERGYSHLFNWNDFYFFRKQTKGAFNRSFEIAELFISEASEIQCDFSQYVF